MTTPDWDGALCRQVDPELWFPPPGLARASDKARAVCRRCPLIVECREFALSDDSRLTGIWGGLTEFERNRLRTQRRRRVVAA